MMSSVSEDYHGQCGSLVDVYDGTQGTRGRVSVKLGNKAGLMVK